MIIRAATTITLIAGLALSAASAMADEQRVTGGDNAYYIASPSEQGFSATDFSWPEHQFKGGDAYDGPEETGKDFNAYVVHEDKKGGDNQ